jgi:hypothetical protein
MNSTLIPNGKFLPPLPPSFLNGAKRNDFGWTPIPPILHSTEPSFQFIQDEKATKMTFVDPEKEIVFGPTEEEKLARSNPLSVSGQETQSSPQNDVSMDFVSSSRTDSPFPRFMQDPANLTLPPNSAAATTAAATTLATAAPPPPQRLRVKLKAPRGEFRSKASAAINPGSSSQPNSDLVSPSSESSQQASQPPKETEEDSSNDPQGKSSGIKSLEEDSDGPSLKTPKRSKRKKDQAFSNSFDHDNIAGYTEPDTNIDGSPIQKPITVSPTKGTTKSTSPSKVINSPKTNTHTNISSSTIRLGGGVVGGALKMDNLTRLRTGTRSRMQASTRVSASDLKKNKKKTRKEKELSTAQSALALASLGKKKKRELIDAKEREEREKIKEFWLGLTDSERRALVKLEKEAVLKKMKEQQKHTCSCSVCGRRRTVIEEELEMLYDAYYEELEHYEEDGQTSKPPHQHHHHHHHQQAQAPPPPPPPSLPPPQAFNDPEEESFNFAKSLTVRGGILTVADDLLKNEGKKFLDMMEKLAERRMKKEESDDESDCDDEYPEDYEDNDNEEEEEDDEITEEQRLEVSFFFFSLSTLSLFLCFETTKKELKLTKNQNKSTTTIQNRKDDECFKCLQQKCLSSEFCKRTERK